MDSHSRSNFQANSHGAKTRIDTATTKYCEYPPSQPFIHDDYRRDITKPIITYPESNRQGVMSALKNLQEKMKQIEREKLEAEQRAISMSCVEQPNQTRIVSSNLSVGPIGDTMQASDVHGRLLAQEERCRALERQLDRTRIMVQQAEQDRAEALRKMAQLRTDNLHTEAMERRVYSDKITELEREQLRLMATQTLAHPVAEPELRPDDEDANDEQVETVKPLRRRKKRSMSAARTMRPSRGAIGRKYPGGGVSCSRKMPGSEPPEHFHLNLAEIPFLTGKSTGQSHSVSANFQEVLSLMKSHNPKLCAGPQIHARAGQRCGHLRGALRRTTSAQSSRDVDEKDDGGSPTPPAEELVDLIVQLENEFGQLSFEHEDLTRQIREAGDQHLRYDLERELDGLVSHMEAKGEQIVKLKRLQSRLPKRGSGKKLRGRGSGGGGRSRPMIATTRTSNGGEVLVTTTISTKGKGSSSQVRPAVPGGSCSKAQGSLHLLKDLKKIQSTLRTDDIIWDC